MGNVSEEERVLDVDETIFVAVGSGNNFKQSETTLFWALKNFVGMNICLLHVHRPSHLFSPSEGNSSGFKLKQLAAKAYREFEGTKLRKLLNQYLLILTQAGVRASEVWIEMDNVGEGIVEMIARHDIRWLVMGAAADEHYTEGAGEDNTELEAAPPLLLLNSATEIEKPEPLSKELSPWLRNLDAEEDIIGSEELSRHFTPLLIDQEDKADGESDHTVEQAIVDTKNSKQKEFEDTVTRWKMEDDKVDSESDHTVEQAIVDTKNSEQKEFEDTATRWKMEDDAMEARCKANAFERLCTREIRQRKELEELLVTVRQEIEGVMNEHNKFVEQVQTIQDIKLLLERQLAESQCTVKELEDRIMSAVELLISFREKRDNMRIEHKAAIGEVKRLSTLINGEAASFCRAEYPVFTFVEIIEATHNFDPSWKIGEGRYGSVYKGVLRHMNVAIKMLPSYGSKTQLDFQNEVEVLCKVRHPNLVTLIGTCPESRSLVYEYLRNGSLEDHLASKDNAQSLPWLTRTSIAIEICSALIFLHSNIPHLVHGNLKPSNILLDANFVSKVGDLGIVCLIPQNENPANFTKICNDPNATSVYMDPEYLETGKLRQESDVYSFGIILLQLLTARPLLGIVNDVKCALENDSIDALLDVSAGDWPLELAKELAYLALRCCEKDRLKRMDLCDVHEAMRASCAASKSCLVSKKLHRAPSHFVCPILQEVMIDPQIAADGFTYEEEAIQGWFKSGHNTSPMTNLQLEHCNLVPNYALQYAIQQWQLQV